MKRNPLVEELIGKMIGFVYFAVASTFRYKLEFEDEADRAIMAWDLASREPRPGQNCLYAFFHQDEYSMIGFFQKTNIAVLVSQSKDGSYTDAALRHLGYQTVRGSSTRRAIAGFIEAVRKVQAGHKFTMAVDGPRGPLHKVKDGIPKLSEKTGRPVFPLRAYVSWKYVFKNAWNQARLPLPFTKIVIKVGKLKVYAENEELEKKLLSL
ncbi:MAG: DUF374 domain-containing protein [Bacteriovoracaceae bacterium]|nr:DUF374 domain-containing protein [Bacteriovoracaceae bacterium]